jgi:ubiquinone/menaquinone biosynthesis C-methylase UbiE
MDQRLLLRLQRYGWDRAADRYDASWCEPLAVAQKELLRRMQVRAGERVLDIACGTGGLACELGDVVGSAGAVVGIDLSQRMVDIAASRAHEKTLRHVNFMRMDAQSLALADASFDVVLCCFGLMYVPDPESALAEIRRVLRPGGRVGIAVWGERRLCAWAPVLSIVDEEVASEVCPLFFRLGAPGTLDGACAAAGLPLSWERRLSQPLRHRDADEACDAMFVAGPVALAWSRFDAPVRTRVRERYLSAIDAWRREDGYALAAEFVVAVHGKGA